MFGGEIWDKLLKCIFENFEIPQIKLQKKRRKKNKIFKNHYGDFLQKSLEPNMLFLVNQIKPRKSL